jgi:hypothetical protein
LAEASIIRAIWSEDTLREVMTRFWAEHFNTNWGTVRFYLRNRFQNEGYANADALSLDYATYFEWQQNDLFRTRAFGTFRSLLEASAGSAGSAGSALIPGVAMMVYLDSVNSQGPKPNENYARELFELHTMGPTSPSTNGVVTFPMYNYSYQDILDGAAIFSGWTLTNTSTAPTAPNLVFSFRPTLCGTTTTGHLTSCPPIQKTLFDDGYLQPYVGQFSVNEDQLLPTEGLALLNHLANSPATAYFISKKLYRLFIKDVEPAPFDPLLMQCVNAWYTIPGGNIQGVLQVLFTSNEFLNDTTTRWTNERQPLEAVAQTVDTFHGLGFNTSTTTTPSQQRARITRVRTLIEQHGGQLLYRYGPPDGFTRGDSELLTTSRMLGSTRLRQELYTLFGPFTDGYPSVFFNYFATLGFLNWADQFSIVNWFNFVAFNNELSGGDQLLLRDFLEKNLSGNLGNTLLTDAATNFPVFVQRVTTGLAYIACHSLNSLK